MTPGATTQSAAASRESVAQSKKASMGSVSGAKGAKSSPAEETAARVHAGGCAVLMLLGAVFFLSGSTLMYRLALLGLVAACVAELYIVMVRNGNNSGALAAAEETPYACLAVALYLLPASGAAVLPLMVRALFGVAAWARAAPELRGQPLFRQHVQPSLETLGGMQPQALQLAAGMEILALPWMVLGVLRTGIMLPVFYFMFVRWQHGVSPRTRLALASLDNSLTRATAHPSCPPAVRAFYANARAHLSRVAVRRD